MWEPLLFPYFSMVIFLRVPRCYWDLRFGLEDRDNARFWFYWWLRVPRLVSMSLRTYFHHRKFCGLILLLVPLVLLLDGRFQCCCFMISGSVFFSVLGLPGNFGGPIFRIQFFYVFVHFSPPQAKNFSILHHKSDFCIEFEQKLRKSQMIPRKFPGNYPEISPSSQNYPEISG